MRSARSLGRAAGYGALAGAAADLWVVAIPAALSGRHESSVQAYTGAMLEAAAGAAGPLILAGALGGMLAGALWQWSLLRQPTGSGDGTGQDDNGAGG